MEDELQRLNALLQAQQKPPAGAKDDCVAFTAVVTEAYFKNIRDEFKAVAPNTLYLGCRFAGSTKAAVQIGAKYCDVISYNLYRHTLDDFKLPEGRGQADIDWRVPLRRA